MIKIEFFVTYFIIREVRCCKFWQAFSTCIWLMESEIYDVSY